MAALIVGLCQIAFLPAVRAFAPLHVTLVEGNRLQIEYPGTTNTYHVLLVGERPDLLETPLAVQGPLGGTQRFVQPLSPSGNYRFYRVARYSTRLPGDQDGDGMDDLYELKYPALLNPLDPADARLDPDGDGLSNYEEAQRQTDPSVANPATVLGTSPADGESGVAVTRETIFRLSQPLAADVVLTASQLRATAAGRTLLTRSDLSSDRRRLTLFYLENLPADEVVTVRLSGAGLKLANGQDLDVDGNGLPGGVKTVTFSTLGILPAPGTSISGTVYDSEKVGGTNRPLAGVTISVDGAEETMRTVTDALGRFKLSPCPVGRFFVHVDGRTALLSSWPNGDYYPYIGKAWFAVADSAENRATPTGEIFLPRIVQGTLQVVAAGASTKITFPPGVISGNPALAGVFLEVPGNSLFGDNGVRGGRVGMAPVPPDRLPEPLPGGLRFPLVITVQTDGPSNFDRPVTAQFPNLPDAVTGKTLPAGAKSALWSFNHDTGRWELQGPMTVSADGKFVRTDDGVGIRQPGWHGVAPGSPPNPPPAPPPSSNPPPDPTPCPPGTEYQPAWNLAMEAAKCGANLFRLGDIASAGINVVQGLEQMLSSLYSMHTAASANPGQILPLLTPIVTSLSGQKQIIKGIVDAFNAADPVDVSFDALNCALGLAKTSAALDCALNCRSSDPDCVQFAQMMTAIQDAAAITQAFATGRGEVTLLCVAFDQITVLLGLAAPNAELPTPLRGRGQPAADRELSPAEREQLLQLLTTAETEAAQLLTLWSNRMIALNQPQLILAPVMETAAAAIWNQGMFVGALVRVTGSDGTVFRGRVGADGVLPLPVALPGVRYTVAVYNPENQRNAWCQYTGTVPATPFTIPTPIPGWLPGGDDLTDTDHDGLPDYAEAIAGTDPARADSDNDGVDDLTEINQATDPLVPPANNLLPIASLDTPGDARELAIQGSFAVVADGAAGIAIVDLTQLAAPKLLAALPVGGVARAVAVAGHRGAVAADTAGLVIVDLSNPAAPTVRSRVALPGNATSVAIRDGFAYVALSLSGLAVVDLESGALVQRVEVPELADMVAFSGDHLCLLTASSLEIREPVSRGLKRLGQYSFPFTFRPLPGGQPVRSLATIDGLAYIGTGYGVIVVDVHDPKNPVLMGAPATQQAVTHSVKVAADNTLLTVTSFSGVSTLALTTYEALNPTETSTFRATRSLGDEPKAVVEYQGHAVVAKGAGGIQIVRYFTPDPAGEPALTPSLTLPTTVPSGQTVRWRPDFGVNRRVASAELLVDGTVVASASAWPFELEWPVARVAANRTVAVSVRCRGFGGGEVVTPAKSVTLLPPAFVPVVLSQDPAEGATVPYLRTVTFEFSEALDPKFVSAAGVTLRAANGTVISPVSVRLLPGNRLLRMESFGALPAGPLELVVSASVLTTAAGQNASGPLVSHFTRVEPVPTIQWVSDVAGNWENPANWQPARVPIASDIVRIDRPAADPVVTLGASAGQVTVAALICREPLKVVDGDLTVAGQYLSEISGVVTTGGTANFRANRDALLVVSGLASGSGGFYAGIGGQFVFDPSEGVIELPNLTTLSGGTQVTFDARSGSRVAVPRWSGTPGYALNVPAVGGEVSLDALGPQLNQQLNLRVSDGGVLRLPRVEGLDGVSPVASFVSLDRGGVLDMPALVGATALTVFVNDAASRWDAPALQSFNTGELHFTGGERTLAVRAVTNVIFGAHGGAQVRFPVLTDIVGGGFPSFTAEAGSEIRLPVLTGIAGPFSGIFPASFTFRASDGGRIQLDALQQSPSGRILFLAQGSNSVIQLPSLVRFDGTTGGSPGALDAGGGARIECRLLNSVENISIYPRAGGTVDFGAQRLAVANTEIFYEPQGAMTCGSLRLDDGGILGGSGTLNFPVENAGFVRPGSFFSLGSLKINADYIQLANGKVQVRFNGPDAAQRDVWQVVGKATLDGTLTAVFGAGINLPPGQRFPVLSYGSRIGSFKTLEGTQPSGVTLQVSYGVGGLDLVVP